MMHIEVLGTGPDLVLIHGWAMHGGIFAPLSERLAQQFRVHIVDLPGHGHSRADSHSVDPALCAATLSARLPRAVWVGWSLGGLVALHAALLAHSPLRGCVAIAASPRFVSAPDWSHGVELDVFAQFDAGLRSDYRATIERFLALEALGSDHAKAELRELRAHVFERGEPALTALEQGMQVLETTDLRGRMAELDLPNLWLAGSRDRLVPAGAMRWAAQQNPQGRFVEFSSGHAPFIGHAAEVAAAITRFAEGLLP
jgi:pimeloyl-[acyl-carrier protein] methyl ester esterase